MSYKVGANKGDQALIKKLFDEGVSAQIISDMLLIKIDTVESFKPKPKPKPKKKKAAKPKKEAE